MFKAFRKSLKEVGDLTFMTVASSAAGYTTYSFGSSIYEFFKHQSEQKPSTGEHKEIKDESLRY